MINTREVAEEYRMSHWAQIMRERIESGLSIKAFCRQMGICCNTYFYWQRKLRKAACEALLPTIPEDIKKDVVPNGWAIVCESESAVQPSAPEKNALYIDIGKSRIEANPDVDLEWLAKVCGVLMTLC